MSNELFSLLSGYKETLIFFASSYRTTAEEISITLDDIKKILDFMLLFYLLLYSLMPLS